MLKDTDTLDGLSYTVLCQNISDDNHSSDGVVLVVPNIIPYMQVHVSTSMQAVFARISVGFLLTVCTLYLYQDLAGEIFLLISKECWLLVEQPVMSSPRNGLSSAYVDFSGVADTAADESAEVVQDASEIQTLLMNAQTKQVKELLRSNHWSVNHPVRRHVWEVICNQVSTSRHETLYKDVLQELFGEHRCPSSLPPFVDPAYCIRYHLNAEGRKCVEKILHVIHHLRPDITYCPMLYPLVSLFIHYMPEDVTFSCVYNLLSEKQAYVPQTQAAHLISAHVVMKLAKKFAKSAFVQLAKEVQDVENLEKIFQSWLSWIFKGLPFPHLVRVIDCFLLEKKKILYRIVIALLILYNKHSGKVEASEGSMIQQLMDFCQNIPVSVERLFKVAYGIRGFSEKLLNQLLTKAEITLKSANTVSERSQSAERLPTSDSAFHLQLTSASLPIVKELRMSESNRTRSLGVIPLGKFKSEIISAEQMSVLWSWLPLHITMNQPEVVYTTNKHGTSLIAFYMTVGHIEPTVLLVKARNDEVFGAYCSSKWNDRKCANGDGKKYIYFGTGETFLFTLLPEVKKYPWVGLSGRGDVPHCDKLFMAADDHMITVGAGGGQGLWLDEQLLVGRTERCSTFKNEPLCSISNFECKIVEVIAFQ